ncbi:MAG: DnaJ domain-containing protein [Spirochaetota bacterium]
MAPSRHPYLPDRQAILHFISKMRPQAGRIIGALSGMILAGPAWLYGLCVGLLLGYMVDTVKAKATSGFTRAGKGSTPDDTTGKNVPDRGVDTDPYQCLGLLPGASMTEVKKAWRRRSRQAHPDAPGGEAEDFIALKSAYEKIMEQLKTDPSGH